MRRPRFFRISLKTSLLVITLFCVWFGFACERARQQKAAVERIEKLGGRVTYGFEPDMEETLRRHDLVLAALRAGKVPPVFDDRPWAPEWLRRVFGDHFFIDVQEVDLSRTFVEDDDLALLGSLQDVKSLYLSLAPHITDTGLVHVGKLTQLERLHLNSNIALRDDGLAHLQGLSNLKTLGLNHTRITDDALRYVCRLTSLETINLSGTKVTSAGLGILDSLPRLIRVSANHLPMETDAQRTMLSDLRAFQRFGRAPTGDGGKAASPIRGTERKPSVESTVGS